GAAASPAIISAGSTRRQSGFGKFTMGTALLGGVFYTRTFSLAMCHGKGRGKPQDVLFSSVQLPGCASPAAWASLVAVKTSAARHRRLCLLAPALVLAPYALLFLITALARVGSPVELEWNEGQTAEQALRFARGEPLYPAP